jgi:ComF family protein
MLERIISLLAPHTCLICGSEGSLLCAWCAPDAVQTIPERCYRCRAISQDSQVCASCRKKTPLDHVWVGSVYDGTAKQLIRKLKFEHGKAASHVIAALLDESLPHIPQGTVITYVPTATKRVRLRGYDHAKLIATHFAKRRGLECTPLLTRHGHSRQVRSTKTARAQQAAQSYTAKHAKTPYKTVLLIDDILTTGATIEAASRILKKSGVKRINAAVFAQKQ